MVFRNVLRFLRDVLISVLRDVISNVTLKKSSERSGW